MLNRIREKFDEARENSEARNRLIGMVLIALFFIGIGYTINHFLQSPALNDNETVSSIEEDALQQQELQQSTPEDEPQAQTQMNPNIADLNTKVEYDLHEEIEEILPTERFVEEFENFLTENNLYTRGTKVTSTGICTYDYENHTRTFDLELNDRNHTVITVRLMDNGDIRVFYNR